MAASRLSCVSVEPRALARMLAPIEQPSAKYFVSNCPCTYLMGSMMSSIELAQYSFGVTSLAPARPL
jgi:hypothetical protein